MENLTVLPSLWSDDMYIENIKIFGNSHHGGQEWANFFLGTRPFGCAFLFAKHKVYVRSIHN